MSKNVKKNENIVFDKNLPKNLPLMFQDRAINYGNSVVQMAKDTNGKFQNYTYKQVYQEIIAFAVKLRDLGINRGNPIGLISDNRREWLITDFAIMSLGACDVPRGCDSMGNEIRFILNYVNCEFSFFENAKQLQKVFENISEVPNLKVAILFDECSEEFMDSANEHGIKVLFYKDYTQLH